ncbi:MAG: hypothetical protein ACKV0T_10775, partial [Planctomycetales bacterium]
MLNIRKRLALGVAVVALHLAAGQSAWAGLAFTGTLTDWLAGVAPVINGDKEFNAQAASPEMILANPSVSIDKIGADYSVTLSFDVGGLDGPFSGWIQFGVAILDPNQVFNSVRI